MIRVDNLKRANTVRLQREAVRIEIQELVETDAKLTAELNDLGAVDTKEQTG